MQQIDKGEINQLGQVGLDREDLGRRVRTAWTTFVLENIPNPPYGWVKPWEELSEPMREVDRVIGETIAVYAIQRHRETSNGR